MRGGAERDERATATAAEVWHRYLAEAPGRRLARLYDLPPPSPRRTSAASRRIRLPEPDPGTATPERPGTQAGPSPASPSQDADQTAPQDAERTAATGVAAGLTALCVLLHRVTGAQELVLACADETLEVLRVAVDSTATASRLGARIADALAESATRPEPTRELLEAARPAAVGLDLPPCHGLVTTMRGYTRIADPLELADLALVLDARPGAAPRIGLLVNSEVIDAEHADRLAAMLDVLLDRFLAAECAPACGAREPAAAHPAEDADPPIGALPLRRPIPRPFEACDRIEPARDPLEADGPAAHFVPLHERILTHGRRTPGAPCLASHARTLAYGELLGASGRLANRLRELGAGPGRSVAVCLPRGIEHIVTQLAVLRTGASVFLCDPEDRSPTARPAPRRHDEAALTDTVVACVAGGRTPAAAVAAAVAPDIPCLRVDDPAEPWNSYPDEFDSGVCAPEAAAHIARTRGASGEPRPARLSHAAWSNSAEVLIAEAGMGPDTVGAWFGALDTGLVQLEALTVLAAGGLLRIPAAPSPAPRARRDWLVSHGVTHTLQLTLMAEALWELDWPEHTALRYMLVTGERMTRWPGPDLPYSALNMYGSTEANLVALCDVSAVAKGLETRRRLALNPPVGRPVAHTRALVVDDAGREVPVGVLGTLVVRGIGQGGGPRPWHSGDLARTWPDGQIEVLGPAASRPRLPLLSTSGGSGGTMQRLRALWAGHAGAREVSADADFFDLGGDSVGAVDLCRNVSLLWGADFSIRELALYPTPGKAAEWLDSGARAAAPAPSPAGYRPTPGQRALWRRAREGRGYDVYRWTVPGPLDRERMLRAWRTLCEACPALRTAVAPDGRHVPGRADKPGEGQARLVLAAAGLPPDTVELTTHQAILDADSVHRLILPSLARLYDDPETKLDVPEADQAAYASAATVQWSHDEADAEDGPPTGPRPTTRTAPVRFVGHSLSLGPDTKTIQHIAESAGIGIEAVLAVALGDALQAMAHGRVGWWRPARLPVYPRIEEVAGSFSVLTELTARAEDRSFAARARAADEGGGTSRGSHRSDGPAAAITVVTGADPEAVTASPVYSHVDLRVVLTGTRLRLHVTGPEDRGAVLAGVAAAFTARLERLAFDELAWWHTGSAEADGLG